MKGGLGIREIPARLAPTCSGGLLQIPRGPALVCTLKVNEHLFISRFSLEIALFRGHVRVVFGRFRPFFGIPGVKVRDFFGVSL